MRCLCSGFFAPLVAMVVLMTGSLAVGQQTKSPVLGKEIKNIESCLLAPDNNTIFATAIGEFNVKGDGALVQIQNGKQTTLLDGFDDPKGMVWAGDSLYITDVDKVWRVKFRLNKFDIPGWQRGLLRLVDDIGRTLVAGPDQFPIKPLFLNDIEADAQGNLYVSDSGDLKGERGAVFRIAAGGKIEAIVTPEKFASVKTPNGLLMDGPQHLLVLDFTSGELHRLGLADNSWTKIAEGFPGGDGLIRDWDGNLYVTQWSTGEVSVLRSQSKTPGEFGKYGPRELLSKAFEQAADLGIDARQGHILVPDMKAGTITSMPVVDNNPRDVDTRPFEVDFKPIFDDEFELERPLLVTSAGDKSGRVFVGTQWGKVFAVKSADGNAAPKLFLDLTSKTTFVKERSEEGFLGMAFHPQFAKNREVFVYYSPLKKPSTAVVSRFKVSESDTVDLKSEEELMTIDQPFWNHNGGTVVFGPDGMLYVGLGDGGSANDPYDNGQDLATPLGGVLRIDVDRRDPGKTYAVPKDNPLVGRAGACEEKWAWGFRNLWRISFDRDTGTLWGADVGQDIWEEINLITRGGNYGWRRREAMHPFTAAGSGPKSEYVDPVWEYHHDDGKSITGGHVYRGKAIPELVGHYIYGDYVSGKMWALKYDAEKKRVVANRPLLKTGLPIMSFGEDDDGEIYVVTDGGKKVTRMVPTGK